MLKKVFFIALFALLTTITVWSIGPWEEDSQRSITRLTYSEGNRALFPCLSDDGRQMLYVLEINKGDTIQKSLKILSIDDGKEKELFRDNTHKAPSPFENAFLILGSKPPILSGDGQRVFFTLSLEKPAGILDHYLAMIHSDGTGFTLFNFPFEGLEESPEKLDLMVGEWERVSNFAVSKDGKRIVCVLKGYLGPRKYGQSSGIVLLEPDNRTLRTILASKFVDNKWTWTSNVRQPLTGGGWALCMSGNGEKIIFGAQSSNDDTDYDLYIMDWAGKDPQKLTDFHDRWFSMADTTFNGDKIIFYYNGKEKQGIGTYTINSDGSGLEYLTVNSDQRLEYFDISGDGRILLFKDIYRGKILNLQSFETSTAFEKGTQGYPQGTMPMDFPGFPAFWNPKITSMDGRKIIITGFPQDTLTSELYLLSINK